MVQGGGRDGEGAWCDLLGPGGGSGDALDGGGGGGQWARTCFLKAI